MRNVKFTVLLVACAAGVTQVALADTTDSVTLSRQVNYSDLDVSHAAGVKSLYHRLVLAANSVCEPFDGAALKNVELHRDCVQQSLTKAVASVNNPLLTSYYRSLNGMPGEQLAAR
jgi:UrcA family protein